MLVGERAAGDAGAGRRGPTGGLAGPVIGAHQRPHVRRAVLGRRWGAPSRGPSVAVRRPAVRCDAWTGGRADAPPARERPFGVVGARGHGFTPASGRGRWCGRSRSRAAHRRLRRRGAAGRSGSAETATGRRSRSPRSRGPAKRRVASLPVGAAGMGDARPSRASVPPERYAPRSPSRCREGRRSQAPGRRLLPRLWVGRREHAAARGAPGRRGGASRCPQVRSPGSGRRARRRAARSGRSRVDRQGRAPAHAGPGVAKAPRCLRGVVVGLRFGRRRGEGHVGASRQSSVLSVTLIFDVDL
ncbi:UNVERIFIED_ORG: hypothetical protein CLV66_12811 [Actinomadura viridilutea]